MLVRKARDAVEAGAWAHALDLAAQALAEDVSNPDAPSLIAEARRNLAASDESIGERRQMTVMVCDLRDSTGIGARLGAEAARDLVLEIYQLSVDAIAQFDGRVGKYVGDGVLAHFSYPRAHEDDARRATLAALTLVEGIGSRAAHWQRRYGETVEVGIGIDTGVVVIGPVGGAPWLADDIVGDPPNIASRVQQFAPPNGVLVTDATYNLIEGWFDVESLGAFELRNYPRPVVLHRIRGPTAAESQLEAVRRRTPLVGRTEELDWLRAIWAEVVAGGPRVLSIVGEPGIGKSRLLEHLGATVAADGMPHISLNCSPLHRASSLRPFVIGLQRYFGLGANEEALGLEALRDRMTQLGIEDPIEPSVGIVARLLGIQSDVDLLPEELRRRTFETIVELIRSIARTSPLLLTVDDLQDADPSTRELLAVVAEAVRGPMLMVAASRTAVDFLGSHVQQRTLVGIGPAECAALVRSVQSELPMPVVDDIVSRSNGVPLFAEELARTEGGPSPGVRLTELLTARLDDLGTSPKRLAGVMATAGNEIRFNVLAELVDGGRQQLADDLRVLVDRRIVVMEEEPYDTVLRFRHILLREVAYHHQLSTRRSDLHRRIADILSRRPSEFAPPEVVAHHFTLAGDLQSAAGWWRDAGNRAAASGANAEAIEHLHRGLQLVGRLPEGETTGTLELDLQLRLGMCESIVHGYTSVEAKAAFERALTLADRQGDSPSVLPAVWGAWTYYLVLAEHRVAVELAERALSIAEGTPAARRDGRLRWEAGAILGYQRLFLGDFRGARAELELACRHAGIAPVADFPQDPAIASRASLAVTQWCLGELVASERCIARALAEARELDDATRQSRFTRAWVACFAAWLAQLNGDAAGAMTHASDAVAIAQQHGYPTWLGAGLLHIGIAQCALDPTESAVDGYAALVEAWRSVGRDDHGVQRYQVLMTPYFMAQLADARRRSGRPDTALATVDTAIAASTANGEEFYTAELHRLRAGALHDLGHPAATVASALRMAATRAEEQSALSFELRAALDGWRATTDDTGAIGELHRLRAVVGRFDPRASSADLEAARAVLRGHESAQDVEARR
jgi:class 3 adenylate cyclase